MATRTVTVTLTRKQALVAASWLASALEAADQTNRTRRIGEVVRKLDRALATPAPDAGKEP